jgi:hypothetical protein
MRALATRSAVEGIRGKRGVRRAAVLLLLLAAACSNAGSVEGSVSASEVWDTIETTVGAASRAEETRGTEGPFVASLEASGGSSYDADTLLAVRHGLHEGYERVVLDLGTGEEPAGTAPEWRLMSPAGDGLLSVTLPSVSATGVSGGTFGDDLLNRPEQRLDLYLGTLRGYARSPAVQREGYPAGGTERARDGTFEGAEIPVRGS